MHIQSTLAGLSVEGILWRARTASPRPRIAPLRFDCPWKQGLSAMDVDPGPFVFRRLHVFTNGHLNETCKSGNPALQGANGPATRSAGQGARDTADGSSVLPGASRSQLPRKTDAAVSKPRGETMIGIWADMRSCKSAMLQPCRSASREGHPRGQTGSASRPSAIAGVA